MLLPLSCSGTRPCINVCNLLQPLYYITLNASKQVFFCKFLSIFCSECDNVLSKRTGLCPKKDFPSDLSYCTLSGSLTPGIKNQICLRLSPIEKWAFFMKKSCQFFKIYIASFCVLCYNIVIYAYPEVPHESQNQQVQTRSSLLHH